MLHFVFSLVLVPVIPKALAGEDEEDEVDVGEVEVEEERPADADSQPGEDVLIIDFGGELLTGGGLGRILDRYGAIEVRGLGGLLDLTTLSIRGSTPAQSPIYLAGIPLTPETGGVFDLSLLPSGLIARARVTRGAGVLAGAGLAGGVNFEVWDEAEPYVEVSIASFGTFSLAGGRTWTGGSGAVNLAFSRVETDGGFTYTRHDGKKYTRENNARRQTALVLSASRKYESREDGALLFAVDRSGGVPGLSEFPSPLAREDDSLILVGASRKFKDFHGGDLKLALFARASHTVFVDPDPYLGAPVNTSRSEYASGMEARLRLPVDGDILGIKAALGSVRLDDERYGDPRRSTASLMAWREFYRGKYTYSLSLAGEAASDGGAGWRGKLGVVREIGGGLDISASAARAFRRPNFTELYYPESGFAGGNPDLDNETGFTLDLGTTWRLGGTEIALVGFWHRYSESIRFVPVTQYRIRAENTGAVRSRGVSLDFSHEFGSGYRLTGSYTRLDAEYLDGGLPLAGRAPRKLSLGLGRSSGRWDWALNWLHRAAAPADRFGSIEVPGADDLSAAVSFDAGKGFLVTIQGFNLLDEDLRDALNFPAPGRSLSLSVRYTW